VSARVFAGERAASDADHALVQKASAMPLTVETVSGRDGETVVTRQHVTIGDVYEETDDDASLVATLADVVRGETRGDGGGAAGLFCYRPGWAGDEIPPSARCERCGRNMDKGEPHTAECPSAIAQDAEEGTPC
jgi:hypothetical protein